MSTTDKKVISISRQMANKTLEIPAKILEHMYTIGSLKNVEKGIAFSLKNPMSDATVRGILDVQIDGAEVPSDKVFITMGDKFLCATAIDDDHYIPFPLAHDLEFVVLADALQMGEHRINVAFIADPFGEVSLDVTDTITEPWIRQQNCY